MTRKASSHFEGFDPEVIEAARDVASRAGVPLEAWIASVVPQAVPSSEILLDRPAASADRKVAHFASGAPRSKAALEIARTAAAETDASLSEGFTAIVNRLDGLDRSMEAERRAEQRRLEEIEARIDRALQVGPAQQVTERLGDIERRVAQLGDQVTHTRPPGKRGKAAVEEMREAVEEIRQRQRQLAGQVDPVNAVATIHRDLARKFGTETAAPRRPIGLPAYVAEELNREAARLREALADFPTAAELGAAERALNTLIEAVGTARADADLAEIAVPVEVARAKIERIATDAATHEDVAADIQHFAGRIDVAAAFDDATAEGTALRALITALDDIRATVAGLAEPEQIEGLTRRAAELSERVAAVASADPSELLPLLAQIRSDESRVDLAAIADDLNVLTRQVDASIMRAEAAAAAAAAAHAEMESATSAPAPFASDDVASLHVMLRNLAEKVDRVGEKVGTEGLDALERQVLTLVHKIEAPHALDPAVNSLERTMTDLMHQVEALRTASPNEEVIERATRTAVTQTLQAVTLNASTGDIGLLRSSLADMQARQIASDERLSDKLEGVQSALDRLATRLGAAEQAPTLRAPSLDERLMASTSPDASRPTKRAAMPNVEEAAKKDPLIEALLEPNTVRPNRSAAPAPEMREPAPEPIVAPKADVKVEAKATPSDGDIKTSFIAAARRAAQAAQAELAAEGPLERHTRARPSVTGAPAATVAAAAKVAAKGGAERNRKPLLLGLAAVVLTLGAIGLRSGDDGVPQLSSGADAGPQQAAQSEKFQDAQKMAEAPKPADAPRAAEAPAPQDAPKTASAPPSQPSAPQAPVATKPPEAPAPAKVAIPQVAGMPVLAGELGSVPPALERLKQAALSGDGNAVWELAVRIGDGRGMPRDLAVATKLYERLATAGYAPAQYKLGAHYEKGTGVARDLAQAKLWYGRAAEQGHARAMHNLGVIYAENPGAGGKPDFVSAATWFRQGAEHGVRDSQYNIAVLYARGLGLSQDLVQSYAWFSAAAAQGDDDAGKKRDDVATKLSPPDLARAKGLASSFKPRRTDSFVNDPPAFQDGPGSMSLLGAPLPNTTAFTPPGRKAI
ncbi:MAG: SEL1-like repeat protein [Parafilimonas terrae]|nr:SEL1-like repeat protein [Parafilimonas terrae]